MSKMASVKESLLDKESALAAVAAALGVLLRFQFRVWGPETGFDRTFNQLGRLGLSLSARTSSFFGYYFLLFPALLLGFWLLFGYCNRKHSIAKSVCDEIAGVFVCTLPLFFLLNYSADREYLQSSQIPLTVTTLLMLLTFLGGLIEKYFEKSDVYHLLILSFSEELSFLMLFHDKGFAKFGVGYRYLLFAVLFGAQLCLVVFLEKKAKLGRALLRNLSAFLAWLPFVLCLALEFVFILIGRGLVISRSFLMVCCITLIYVLITMPVGVKLALQKRYLKPGYLGLVSGVGAMLGMPVFSGTLSGLENARLFEMGNVTSFVDTILVGDLPGVNYFSAHLLSDSWMNYLYYLLNGDLLGAVRGNYSNLSVTVALILIYFLLKEVLGEELSFLLCLFFPFYGLNCFGIGPNFLAVLALFYLLRKNNTKSYVLFWGTLLFGVLFQLDHGLGIGIGCMAALAIMGITRRIVLKLRPFFGAMAGVSAVALLLFIVGCLKEGVSILGRLEEFVCVTLLSNSGWAVESLGDPNSLPYFVVYCFVPISAVLMLFYLVTDLKTLTKERESLYCFCVLLGISQIIFASRTLVLYTLGNGVTPRFFSYYPYLCGLFAVYVIRSKGVKRAICFAVSFLLTVFLQEYLVTGFSTNINKVPLVCAEMVSITKDFHYDFGEGSERTVADAATTALMQEMNDLFDTVMDKQDTFLDFADVSGLYGLLGRERPCYVSQSPSLLTTESTQRAFIKEIEKNGKAKLAILAAQNGAYLDAAIGIKHAQRYYLVSEYIYQNYVPLTVVREYAIWCRSEEYETMSKALLKKGYVLLEPEYGFVSELHTYDYGNYAWAWANADKQKAVEQPQLAVLEADTTGTFMLREPVKKDLGNYMKFTVEGVNNTCEASLIQETPEGEVLAVYSFRLLPGKETYLIRISNDYAWYSREESNFRPVLPEGTCFEMEILEGDGQK